MRPEIPCALMLLLAAAPTMGASFQGLGDFAGGSFESIASGVSADGSVVAGRGTTASGMQAFRWTAATGMVSLGNLPDGSLISSWATDVSADGATVVGSGDPGGGLDYLRAFRWTQATGMVSIPNFNGATYSEALGVSADGSVVVGVGGTQAFRWTAAGGTAGLGYLPGNARSHATGVSDDGSVVVGLSCMANYALQQAFRWTQNGGMQAMGYLPGDSSDSWVDEISPDGSVIVGTSAWTHPFRWTQSTGMVGLGHLPGMNVTHPQGVSNYGSVIVGNSYNNTTYHCDAFIWDAAGGLRHLQNVLQNVYGLNLAGWHLSSVSGISSDGSVIVGQGTNPSGQSEAFRVVLTPDLNYRVLHSFTGGVNDGAKSYGDVIGSGSKLYGMTLEGGSSNMGTVFQVNTDGTGFGLLHSFAGATVDGAWPLGSLFESDGVLYGMTSSGMVDSYGGTIFRLNSNGSGFQVLRSLAVADGMWPYGAMTLSGSTLYGICTYGGTGVGFSGNGTIFKMDTSGTGFQKLRTFTGSSSDGAKPHGSLTQSDSVFYGATSSGGTAGCGTVFKVNTDGTGFQVLHSFLGGSGDGNLPLLGRLVLSGSRLYGMTQYGGSNNCGVVFGMNTNGTGFGILHSFTGGSDGGHPSGGVIESGSTLYGMTLDGGGDGKGVIFQVNMDGTGFRVLHNFSGTDGSAPYGSMTLWGSTLYGMTYSGGSNNLGVIFALDDTTAPTPDPMTWSVIPHGTGLHSISMTATTATDDSGIEYYFTCTSGDGHSSAWQTSPTYTDTGLAEGATCSYTVKARDRSPAQNETSPSTPDAFASALADSAAPTPNPMVWSVVPAATGLYTITMTASTATDVSGVEYFFANLTEPDHDSGWQDGTTYIDTGLANNATYTYQVRARDKSLAQNQTDWSEPNSATTPQYLCTGPITSDLSTNCQVDFLDFAMLAMAWSTPLPLNNNIAVNGDFATDIVPGWTSFALATATGSWISGLDYGYGNPPEAAYMICDMSGGDVDGYFFYQVIPVTPGTRYKLSAQWMGDLTGGSSDPLTTSNWTSIIVTFESGTDPAAWHWTEPNATMYSKVWGIGSLNTDPNGTWNWESVGLSRTNGPADDVYIATDSYMVVAFSMGGLAGASSPWVDVDNIKVEGPGCPTLDLTGDCSLDIKDLAIFVQQWLACTRTPSSECGMQ